MQTLGTPDKPRWADALASGRVGRVTTAHRHATVLTTAGEWRTPILLGFLGNHSRLGCHLQWYLAETAVVFAHGLCQAFMKPGVPRSRMTDNGSPMAAGEVNEALHRLGIIHATTLA